MGIQIVAIDPNTVDYKLAAQITDVLTAAFAEDPFFKFMWGEEYTFTRPVSVGLQPKFRQFQHLETLKFLNMLRDKTKWAFVAMEGDRVVGFTYWTPPEGVEPKKLSLWTRIKTVWTNIRFKVSNWWYFGTRASPHVFSEDAKSVFKAATIAVGINAEDKPAYRAELAHKTYEELQTRVYLREDTFWCTFMVVSPSVQGKGVGKKLFRTAMARMPAYNPTFKDGSTEITGPRHYGLIASSPGVPLYKKLGFTEPKYHEVPVDRGLVLKFRLMHFSGIPKTEDKL